MRNAMRQRFYASALRLVETAAASRTRRDLLLFVGLVLLVVLAPYLFALTWALAGCAVGLICSLMSAVAVIGQYVLWFVGGAYVLKLTARV